MRRREQHRRPPRVGLRDRDGTNRWLFRFGTRGYDAAPIVAHLASGELAAAGSFRAGLDYGSGVLRSTAQAIYVLRFAAE